MLRSLLLLALISTVGCLPPPDRRRQPEQPETPLPEVSIAPKDIFAALADRVERKRFANSDELLSTVRELKEAGDLSQSDFERFEHEFSDLLEKRRDLTDEDAKKLRLLTAILSPSLYV